MIFENELEKNRISKADELRNLGINPYPHFLKKQMSIADFKAKFNDIKNLPQDEQKSSEICTIWGRIKLKRVAGKSSFANIEDESDNIQIYYSRDSLGVDENGVENYAKIKKNIEVGDIILVQGYAFVTQTGEFSIHASSITLAAKAISPLPEKYHGLSDIEIRYRQRYLDMIMDPSVRADLSNAQKSSKSFVIFLRRVALSRLKRR